MRFSDLPEYVEHFRGRVLQDALSEATSSYWLHRSETFTAVGNERCDEIAEACRNAAALAILQTGPDRICPACHTPTSPCTCSCGQTRVVDAS